MAWTEARLADLRLPRAWLLRALTGLLPVCTGQVQVACMPAHRLPVHAYFVAFPSVTLIFIYLSWPSLCSTVVSICSETFMLK